MKKIKLPSLKRTKLRFKVLLSAALLAVGGGALVGGIFAFANNSDEVLGFRNPNDPARFNNSFDDLFQDADRQVLKSDVAVLDPEKKNIVGRLDDNLEQYFFTNDPDNKMDAETFGNAYFARFQENFILEIRYGSFRFLNEYTAVVSAKTFHEFTDWFIRNVSWGPDLIALDNLRIVPGVQTQGNAITLGEFSNQNKEFGEIRFFPDAFFGSLPIFSISAGRGNAVDALTYTLFNNFTRLEELSKYLQAIPLLNTFQNLTRGASAVANLFDVRRLANQSFFVLPADKLKALLPTPPAPVAPEAPETEAPPAQPTPLQSNALLLPAETTAASLTSLLSDFPLGGSIAFSDLQKITIQTATVASQGEQTVLNLFTNSTEPTEEAKPDYQLVIDESLVSLLSLQTLATSLNQTTVNFLDFYDIQNPKYLQQTVYYYENGRDQRFFATLTEARTETPANHHALIKPYQVMGLDVANKALSIRLQESNNTANTSKTVVVSADAYESDLAVFDTFTSLKRALGYKVVAAPLLLGTTPEDRSAVDANNNPLTGLAARSFQVYNEVYPGLVEQVVRKFPNLAKTMNGPHVAKVLNEQGFYEYEIQEGDYQGFAVDDRIGLPLVLAATQRNFPGISTDFLRYVAVHEYGHHHTLNMHKALNDDDNKVIIGGVSVNGGVSFDNFYSAEALRNYLKARTNLDFEQTNVNGQVVPNGDLIRWIFLDKDDPSKRTVEQFSDIWGSESFNGTLEEVLNNPRRRFLQDFEGLKQAAKLRNVNLVDLIYANSFDENSGTLNPFTTGDGEVFAWDEDKQDYVFKKVDAERIYQNLKDGLGNPIPYEKLPNGSFRIKLFDSEIKEGQFVVTKINVHNPDGTPFLNIPLNTPLDENEQSYIEQQRRVVNAALLSLFNNNYGDSGWNTRATNFGRNINFGLKEFGGGLQVAEAYVEELEKRNDTDIFIPYDIVDERINSNFDPVTKVAAKPTARYLVFNDASWRKFYKNENINPNKIDFDLLNADSADVLDVFARPNESRVAQANGRFIGDSDFSKVIAFGDSKKYVLRNQAENEPFGRRAGLINTAAIPEAQRPKGFVPLPFSLQFSLNTLGLRGGIESLLVYVDPVVNGNNSSNLPAANTNGAMHRGNLLFSSQTINSKFRQSNGKFQNSPRLVFNPIGANFDANLFHNAFNKMLQTDVLFTNSNRQSRSLGVAPGFANFEEFFDFVSLDYSKATLQQVNGQSQWNWDLAYVKTKFDVDAFLAKWKMESPNEAASDTDKNHTNEKQAAANELIKRFVNSNFFLAIKSFNPVTELEQNAAIFDQTYGEKFVNENWNKAFVLNESDKADNPLRNELNLFTKQEISNLVKKYYEENIPSTTARAQLDLLDLKLLFDDHYFVTKLGNISTFDDILWSTVQIENRPSDDVVNYNNSRTEFQLADKFTDYVYTLAETLTRDYLQTTFLPNFADFQGLPTFLTNVNEATTGFDYVVDATKLNVFNSPLVKVAANEITNNFVRSDQVITTSANHNLLLALYKTFATEWNSLQQRLAATSDITLQTMLQAELTSLQTAFDLQWMQAQAQLARAITNNSLASNGGGQRNSSYFGQLQTIQNGYFKDRFQKKVIGTALYNDDRTEKISDNIRLTGFHGEKITSVPKAFFVSQLKNYGVGDRTVSGIFRNKELDALALYGFLPNELAAKVHYLKFTNQKDPNDVTYLKVNITNTNNLHYLTKQGDPNSKVTLHDLSYSTWISDYALMGKYRETLLQPGGAYDIDFADANQNVVAGFTLGSRSVLAENGKLLSQSPVALFNANNPTNQTTANKASIHVDFQFNIES